jgi:hypothetical protein
MFSKSDVNAGLLSASDMDRERPWARNDASTSRGSSFLEKACVKRNWEGPVCSKPSG